MSEQCKGCRFWLQVETTEEGSADDPIWAGVCRRYPPVLTDGPSDDYGLDEWQFPATRSCDWCGEYVSLRAGPEVAP